MIARPPINTCFVKRATAIGYLEMNRPFSQRQRAIVCPEFVNLYNPRKGQFYKSTRGPLRVIRVDLAAPRRLPVYPGTRTFRIGGHVSKVLPRADFDRPPMEASPMRRLISRPVCQEPTFG